jgi:hypothetical protein
MLGIFPVKSLPASTSSFGSLPIRYNIFGEDLWSVFLELLIKISENMKLRFKLKRIFGLGVAALWKECEPTDTDG